MNESLQVDLLVQIVNGVEFVLSAVVGVVLARRWTGDHRPATASAAALFLVLAAVLASSLYQPTYPLQGWTAIYIDVVICLLLLVPFFLVQLTRSLGGVGAAWYAATIALLGVQVVVIVVTPPLPGPGEPRPLWASLVVALIVGAWAVQSILASAGLWRLGRAESSSVRHRMRTLSAGSLILALTLVVSGASGGSTASAWVVGISLLGLVGIALYALAFLAPAFVRVLWRQGDLTELGQAERGLMQALTREEVASTIVPVLAGLLGGSGAALLDQDGTPIHISGRIDLEGQDWAARRVDAGRGTVHGLGQGLFMAQMARGCLVVSIGRLSPVFGTDESHLLNRVCTMVDLALTRVALFGQERESRAAAEAASAELETLLYSVSHDLRSPLISVMGYLDLLRSEHEAELSEGGSHYLERISVNGLYMQSLIADLLELSRIGRVGSEDELVDLAALAHDVIDAAGPSAGDVRVEVDPSARQVRISSVRARQLLTNLLDNALKYGGRDDLEVVVSVTRGPAGEVRLAVSDNGRGIPAEYRDRVLRVFERLDAPKSSPGTGIGLAICKRIAESLGGSLVMEGPAPGNDTGTTALVTLPRSVLAAVRPLPIQGKEGDWVSASTAPEGAR